MFILMALFFMTEKKEGFFQQPSKTSSALNTSK